MFLHGGWMYLFGNMLFLHIFGNNLQDELDHSGNLLFYLALGIANGVLQAASDPTSTIPTVGASGAIAGVMRRYFCFTLKLRLTFIYFLIFFRVFSIPAYVCLGVWFGLQLSDGWVLTHRWEV
jgi:membrane associated rhomboid family serine protease